MSSIKQIEANRRNALCSSGPTSLEGKQRSRLNAYRHGLTAETVIPNLEDAEDYEMFQAAVIADYDAESAVERELVLRLASLLWRLRRASGIETELFAMMSDAECDGRPAVAGGSAKTHLTGRLLATPDRSSVVRGFLRLVELPTAALDRLSRYEYFLWRQARQILLSLEHSRPRHPPSSRPHAVRYPPFAGE